ncbi:MAG: hypothetical protein NC395_09440 [Prevotella sp.]|nr:hypothetical protein [Prevotella sp.]
MVSIFLVIFIILGVLQVIFPEYAWWFEHGMPKNAEPSDGGILMTRIGGVFLAVLGVIMFLITLG